MRTVALVLTALLAIGLTVAIAGPAAATHDNPNWGNDAGANEDCTTGHMNPHDDGENYAGPDDCGTSSGNVPSHAGHPVP